jgi:anti-sigma B factor antagonist
MRQARRSAASGPAAPPPEFRLQIQPERDAVRVCPIGEIDVVTVDRIRAEIQSLRSAGFARLILDLRGATFMDSTGLHLVLDAQASSAEDGWSFAVIPGPAGVQRAFEAAGLTAEVRFVDAAGNRNGAR